LIRAAVAEARPGSFPKVAAERPGRMAQAARQARMTTARTTIYATLVLLSLLRPVLCGETGLSADELQLRETAQLHYW
jgi:hypothetical protein